MSEAVRSGVIFFKTSSDGILTRDVVPSQFIISVDDTEKKTNLYRRHEDTAHSAHGSGGEVGVQELVKSYEATSSKRTGSTSPAASTGAPAASPFFPGKVKPPPPNVAQAAGMPGYAHSRLLPPPPKGEAPKPPSVAEGPKTPPKIEGPKTPPKADAPKTPPKEGASARSAPEVPKAVTVAVEPAKKMGLRRRRQLFPARSQLCQWHHRLRPSWNLFRRLRPQRFNRKNKELPLRSLHQQSWLQAQSQWCRR